MSVKEKLIKYYVDAAWNIAIRNDITNTENTKHNPNILTMDVIGVWE